MASTLDICAPADQTEGTRSQVLRWLKSVGDTVTEHEPLIELETDKVTVEVPAPASGVLREIFKAEQEEIAPGDVLGRLETAEDPRRAGAGDGVREVGDGEASGGEAGGGHADDARAGSASADADAHGAAGVHGAAGAHQAAGAEGVAHTLHSASPGEPPRVTADRSQSLSPAVRRLLSERGLDASSIRGTGDGGRITVDDVLTHAMAIEVEAKVSAGTTQLASATPGVPSTAQRLQLPRGTLAPANSRSIPHSAIRKRIADHMVQSLLQTAPHVTTVFEADLSAVIVHRSAHRKEFQQQGVPLTFTAYFLAAIVDAIKVVPEANSRWTDTALEIYDEINIGVATAVENVGLMVPVVRNVQSLDLFAIAGRLDQLVSAARAGRLEPADVRGGTFTISNHGVSGSLLATPIVINQPQSAILGIGKMEKRPVVSEEGDEEKVVVRPRCYVTLTIDHRVMDGHQANRFLQTFVRKLEAWPRNA